MKEASLPRKPLPKQCHSAGNTCFMSPKNCGVHVLAPPAHGDYHVLALRYTNSSAAQRFPGWEQAPTALKIAIFAATKVSRRSPTRACPRIALAAPWTGPGGR